MMQNLMHMMTNIISWEQEKEECCFQAYKNEERKIRDLDNVRCVKRKRPKYFSGGQ